MEIEVKFRVDLDKIKEKLESLGVIFSHFEDQEDVYFRVPRPKLLRVRAIHNMKKYYITYKEIMDERNEEFYEVEFEVGNFNKALEMFKRLGFEVEAVIKKKRWVYKLNDITFELNRVEKAGDFLDIEVIAENPEEAKKKIWEVARKLGLSKEDVEPRLYIELISG
ncbi:class IV adenylate cyclase [Pyrococcus sp. ST04]|uniref:class IV adenylate cyclase n=1 Tax=Pyrococcus sp. ST04 TaxID=1183377 RepID=UPI0002605EC5|nr:class IV adenylate cyclase [Pyrococcus sp. ST04]AFK22625.1 putative adenylyl cyclase, CyaB-type [Pyrococcus sp. ST04]